MERDGPLTKVHVSSHALAGAWRMTGQAMEQRPQLMQFMAAGNSSRSAAQMGV